MYSYSAATNYEMAKIYGGINHGLWTDNLLDPVQSKLI